MAQPYHRCRRGPSVACSSGIPEGERGTTVIDAMLVLRRALTTAVALVALGAVAAEPVLCGAGWNERLVYTFGGGCNVGYHRGLGSGGVLNDLLLSRATPPRALPPRRRSGTGPPR
jgi:hypothetical protein